MHFVQSECVSQRGLCSMRQSLRERKPHSAEPHDHQRPTVKEPCIVDGLSSVSLDNSTGEALHSIEHYQPLMQRTTCGSSSF